MAENNRSPASAGANSQSVQPRRDTLPAILVNSNPVEYDTLHVIDTIREFNRFLKAVVSHYEENERLRLESDHKSSDLLHYIELHGDMNASEGYKAYKMLAQVRRERRCRKNENELLAPLYAYIQQHAKAVNELSFVLGRCRGIKETIDKRAYCPRTDII